MRCASFFGGAQRPCRNRLRTKPVSRGTRHEIRYNESFREDSTRISRDHLFRKRTCFSTISRGISRERFTRSFTKISRANCAGLFLSRGSRSKVSRDVSREFHDRFHAKFDAKFQNKFYDRFSAGIYAGCYAEFYAKFLCWISVKQEQHKDPEAPLFHCELKYFSTCSRACAHFIQTLTCTAPLYKYMNH